MSTRDAPKKKINLSTFYITLSILIALILILGIMFIVAWIKYRQTLGELEKNICPTLP